MSYATLMVHLELGRPNTGLLNVAAELADRFKAGIVGIAARQPLQMSYGDGCVSGELYQQDRDDIAAELGAAETEMRTALRGRVAFVAWRATQKLVDLADYVANEARGVDLILTSVSKAGVFDVSRSVDTGELIMQAGRPVLVVPASAETLRLGHVLVAWKDTRETRRAMSDALPLLAHARRVTVVEIAQEEDLQAAGTRVRDVVAWLGRHGIESQGSAERSTGDDATALYAIGQDRGADLVVAGAYGHSRLREWVLGGVTRDLLLSANRFSLLSH